MLHKAAFNALRQLRKSSMQPEWAQRMFRTIKEAFKSYKAALKQHKADDKVHKAAKKLYKAVEC